MNSSPSPADTTPAQTLAETAAPAPRRRGVQALLAVIAAFEFLDGLMNLPGLFGGDISGVSGGLTRAYLVTHPVFAGVALICAGLGRLREAVIALGAMIFMNWLSDIPSVMTHGFELNTWFSAQETLFHVVAAPLLAACAIALAARNERIGLAALFASLPTLYNLFGVVMFGVGVYLHGF